MNYTRCIRFASLGELSVADLELAVDVWLDDALKAPWATKESMKLAGVMCRYMLDPAGNQLNLKNMEDQYQLSADAARRSLVLYALYGMIDAYSTDNNELRAALRLSRLQTFRVLKIKRELRVLDGDVGIAVAATPWSPEPVTATKAESNQSEAKVAETKTEEQQLHGEGAQPTPAPIAEPAGAAESTSALPAAAEQAREPLPRRRSLQVPSTRDTGEVQMEDATPVSSGQDALARSLQRLQRRMVV